MSQSIIAYEKDFKKLHKADQVRIVKAFEVLENYPTLKEHFAETGIFTIGRSYKYIVKQVTGIYDTEREIREQFGEMSKPDNSYYSLEDLGGLNNYRVILTTFNESGEDLETQTITPRDTAKRVLRKLKTDFQKADLKRF